MLLQMHSHKSSCCSNGRARVLSSGPTLEKQLASGQQVCADQQAQVLTFESLLTNANETAFRVTALEQQRSADQQAQMSLP